MCNYTVSVAEVYHTQSIRFQECIPQLQGVQKWNQWTELSLSVQLSKLQDSHLQDEKPQSLQLQAECTKLTCINKNLHVHQFPHPSIMEDQYPLHDDNIRCIDLHIKKDIFSKQLNFRCKTRILHSPHPKRQI